jgi:phosphoribosylformylglycinamidine synthase
MGDLEAAIEGLVDAAEALATEESEEPLPFVSGNVSLYNQDDSGYAIPPSPIVACLGRVTDLAAVVTPGLKAVGNVLVYVGPPRGDVSGSHFARLVLAPPAGGGVLRLDLMGERERQRAVRSWIEGGWVEAARVVGEGGVANALSTMAFASAEKLGAAVEWPPFAALPGPDECLWWSEEPGFLLEIDSRRAPRLLREAAADSLGAVPVGQVRGEHTLVGKGPGGGSWQIELERLRRRWESALAEVWGLSGEPLVRC